MNRLVFDVGGTNMRMALSTNGVLGDVAKVATPADPLQAVAAFEAFAGGRGIEEIVGGVAGIIKDGTVLDSPNLRTWEGFSLGPVLARALGVPTRIYNDAVLAAIGETLVGAGEGYGRVAYLTLGTGVGGALVVNDAAGLRVEGTEPGRQVLEPGRSLESFVGGAALSAEFNTEPESLTQSIYDERTAMLVTGMCSLLDLWKPELFILNGPLVYGSPAFRIPLVVEGLEQCAPTTVPPMVVARFKDASGLQGAAHI